MQLKFIEKLVFGLSAAEDCTILASENSASMWRICYG